MQLPLIIDSTSGQKKIGVAKRTGITYMYATSAAGFDTGYAFINNSTGSEIISYCLLDSGGNLIGSVLNSGSAVPGFGGIFTSLLSTDFGSGKTGVLVAWLNVHHDDGNEGDIKMVCDIAYSTTTFSMVEGLYPPDLRNYSGSPPPARTSKQTIYSVDSAGYVVAMVFINPNASTVAPIGGIPQALSGGPIISQYQPFNGTYWISTINNGSISQNASAFPNTLLNLGLPSSGYLPFTFTQSGVTSEIIVSTAYEFDTIIFETSPSGVGSIRATPRYYT